MKDKNKIGFLFLDDKHHLYHFITVAIALAEQNEVSILTYKGKHDFLYSTLKRLGGSNVKVEILPTQTFRAFTDRIKNRTLPRKLFWMKKNEKYLLTHFDALIFTDYFHHFLLKQRKTAFPKFIKFPHGIAGRAYAFKRDLLDFDLNILFGNYYLQELKERNLLTEKFALIGYPKLNAVNPKPGFPAFEEERPIVLYNPHFQKPTSSWHRFGLDVLEYFFQSEKYNLIFAPHINLFQTKGGESSKNIPEKFFKAKNIFIDLGSEESVNMTYVNRASIYLGDVSSLVFEFIITPRPCLFIDNQHSETSDELIQRLWKCGEVITEIEHLPLALDQASQIFESFRPIQQQLTEENFYSESNSTPSQIAAKAIEEFLTESRMGQV